MGGFVVAGELEVLLSAPTKQDAPILVYVPIDHLPVTAQRARTAFEGVFNYWAPHVPAVTGAMGELLYRVVVVRGSVDPLVVVYRGQEVIVFIRAAYAAASDVRVLYMRRDIDNDVNLERHAGIVVPSEEPLQVPAPVRTTPREHERVRTTAR